MTEWIEENKWIEIDSNAVTHDRDAARVKYLYKADDVRRAVSIFSWTDI